MFLPIPICDKVHHPSFNGYGGSHVGGTEPSDQSSFARGFFRMRRPVSYQIPKM